jgi:exonuclease SbcD
MRILHTSDWHLGRTFKGVPLLDQQVRFTEQVVEVVKGEGIDLGVVYREVVDAACGWAVYGGVVSVMVVSM